MRAMRVLRLVVHGPTREPVVLLGDTEGERCVPVFLRRPQADVVALGRRSGADPLLPQDVLVPLLRGLGHTVDAAEVTALTDGVFEAVLVCDGGTRIPVLPSDALAVAVARGCRSRWRRRSSTQSGSRWRSCSRTAARRPRRSRCARCATS
jgi:uncharacterized protein